MPHLHRIVQSLFQPAPGERAVADRHPVACLALHGEGVHRGLPARRGDRVRDRRRAVAVALPRARLHPLHRRLPDDPAARDRADGRDRARHEGRHRLGLGRGARGLPDLLPRDGKRAPRPAGGRPARGRADALLRRGPLEDPLEAAGADLAAVPVLGVPDRGAARVVGAIISEPAASIQGGLGGAIVNFSQYYTIEPQELWATNIITASSGSGSSSSSWWPRSSSCGARRSTTHERGCSVVELEGVSKEFAHGNTVALRASTSRSSRASSSR